MEKLADTIVPINQLIAKRWSARAFDPNKPVDFDKILSICEAARWAPSSGGVEPWRFIIWDKHKNFEAYSRAFATLDEGNKQWAINAPVLVGVFTMKYWDSEKKEINRWASFDAGSATLSLILQSFDLGLYAHPMGGFDGEMLINNFNIDNDYEALALVAVGYPGNPNSLKEPFLSRELYSRKRNPLGSRFFDSEWSKPIINEKSE